MFPTFPSFPTFCKESLGIIFPTFPSCPTFWRKYWYPNDSLQNAGKLGKVGKMMPNDSLQNVGKLGKVGKWCPTVLCRLLGNLEKLEKLEKWCPTILCKMLENLENLKNARQNSKTYSNMYATMTKKLPNIRAVIRHTITTWFRVCFFHNVIQVQSFRLHAKKFCRLQGGQKAGGGIGHHPYIYIYIYIYI